MMRRSALLVLVLLVTSSCAFYEKNKNVVMLNKKNFPETVFANRYVWVVEFFAPWCGHCKAFAEQFGAAADKLAGLGVHVGAVNCDVEKELCGSFKVEGFPTVLIFESEPKPVEGQKDAYAKPTKPFNGQRTSAAVVGAALREVPNLVKRVDAAQLATVMSDASTKEMYKILLFTDKTKTSDLAKGLAVEFSDSAVLLQVPSDANTMAEYSVTEVPALVVVPPGDAKAVAFDGVVKRETVFSWLKKTIKKSPSKPKSGQSEPQKETKKPEPKDPLLGKLTEVKTQADYDSICNKQGKTMCVLTFLDSTMSEDAGYRKMLTKAAELYAANNVYFGVVDGPLHIDLMEKHFRDLTTNFPSLACIVSSKGIYFNMQPSLTEKHLTMFMDNLLRGSRHAKYSDILSSPVTFPEQARVPEALEPSTAEHEEL